MSCKKTFIACFLQAPAASPASRFAKNVQEGKPWIAIHDLCELLDPINPGNGFTEQDWKVAELKSTKAFRRVRTLLLERVVGPSFVTSSVPPVHVVVARFSGRKPFTPH